MNALNKKGYSDSTHWGDEPHRQRDPRLFTLWWNCHGKLLTAWSLNTVRQHSVQSQVNSRQREVHSPRIYVCPKHWCSETHFYVWSFRLSPVMKNQCSAVNTSKQETHEISIFAKSPRLGSEQTGGFSKDVNLVSRKSSWSWIYSDFKNTCFCGWNSSYKRFNAGLKNRMTSWQELWHLTQHHRPECVQRRTCRCGASATGCFTSN